MKILGIGNAIIDVICKVDDKFIHENNLTKGNMKLTFDEGEFKSLLSKLKIERTISGGSVANSIVGLSQLGNSVGFIGKISNDEFGEKYEAGLKKAEIIFLEGYLWDEGDPKKAFEKAIQNSTKVAMTLSDKFCVDRHKPHFLELVKNKLDIVFANEEEIMSLIDAKNFDDVIAFGKDIKKTLIITRGERGAISITSSEVNEVGVEKNLNIVDLTGAGDLFASGFLHGYLNDFSQIGCLKKGTEMSAKIIQQIGARLN